MYKIIDYEGATVADGFPDEFSAERWMYSNYSRECIRELEFETREEEEWIPCSECEERDNCPDTIRFEGCVLGARTPSKEGGER